MGIRENAQYVAIEQQKHQAKKANEAMIALLTELVTEQKRTNRLLSAMLTSEMRIESDGPASPAEAPEPTAAERVQASWDERRRRQ
jgi:hypothetical protein